MEIRSRRLPQKHTASTILFIQTLWLWKRYSIPYWSFGCLQTAQTFVGAFFFFSLHFCVDWICDSAVENRFCREGDFNGMTSRPLPLHVDMNAAYITRWLKQTLIAGTQVMELHQRFLHVPLILRTGCVFFLFFCFSRIIKATIFCLLDFLCSFCLLISLCNEIDNDHQGKRNASRT